MFAALRLRTLDTSPATLQRARDQVEQAVVGIYRGITQDVLPGANPVNVYVHLINVGVPEYAVYCRETLPGRRDITTYLVQLPYLFGQGYTYQTSPLGD